MAVKHVGSSSYRLGRHPKRQHGQKLKTKRKPTPQLSSPISPLLVKSEEPTLNRHYYSSAVNLPNAAPLERPTNHLDLRYHQRQQCSQSTMVLFGPLSDNQPATRSARNATFRDRNLKQQQRRQQDQDHVSNSRILSNRNQPGQQTSRNKLDYLTGASQQELAQPTHHFIVSEKNQQLGNGQQLCHEIELIRPYDERENPFRPGTELSWEADMMVKLIQRGYPIKELLPLVESAKRIASKSLKRLDSCPQPNQCTDTSLGQTNKHNHHGHARQRDDATSAQDDINIKTKSTSLTRSAGLSRQVSSDDIRPERGVWLNSLKRTKSLPRYLQLPRPALGFEGDSLDDLITSIENEFDAIASSATTTDKLTDQLDTEQVRNVTNTNRSESKKLANTKPKWRQLIGCCSLQ